MNPDASAPRNFTGPTPPRSAPPGVPPPPLRPLPGISSNAPFTIENTGGQHATVIVHFFDAARGHLVMAHALDRIAPGARVTVRPRSLKELPADRQHTVAVWSSQPVTTRAV